MQTKGERTGREVAVLEVEPGGRLVKTNQKVNTFSPETKPTEKMNG